MKRVSSFFEGMLLCLKNKISDIDLHFNYLPYEKFIGILADATMMAWEFGISEKIGITPEVYYIEMMLVLNKKGLVSFFHKGDSGRIGRVELYRKKGLYESFKGLYVNSKKFSYMIKSQKALYGENLKVIERMTALETDEEIVKKFIRYWKTCEPCCTIFSPIEKVGYLRKIVDEFYNTYSSSYFYLENHLVLREYLNLKVRMEDISKELFLDFTTLT